MSMNPDTQEKINLTAIRAASEQALEEVRGLKGLLIRLFQANVNAETQKAATLKSETDAAKKSFKVPFE